MTGLGCDDVAVLLVVKEKDARKTGGIGILCYYGALTLRVSGLLSCKQRSRSGER